MGRRAIGPFTVRQLLLALGSVAVAAVVLSLATRPLGGTEASQIRDPHRIWPGQIFVAPHAN